MVNVEYTNYECLVKKSRLPPNSDVEVVENRTYPKYIPGGDEEAVMGGPWEVHTPLCLWLFLSLSLDLALTLSQSHSLSLSRPFPAERGRNWDCYSFSCPVLPHGGWNTRVSLTLDSGVLRDQISTTIGPEVHCARHVDL